MRLVKFHPKVTLEPLFTYVVLVDAGVSRLTPPAGRTGLTLMDDLVVVICDDEFEVIFELETFVLSRITRVGEASAETYDISGRINNIFVQLLVYQSVFYA